MSKTIFLFAGEHRFLSNFYPANVLFDGAYYTTAEHAYQAAKTTNESDRFRIKFLPSPGQAKRYGKHLQLRPDWEEIKLETMEAIVRDKFTRNRPLAEALKATGDADLIEGNTWGDTFWGVCNGVGQNHLGRILMRVRGGL